jgi:AraC-like DNA-binding protein
VTEFDGESNTVNGDATQLLVPCSYMRIVARELGLQERELPKLLVGSGLSSSIFLTPEDSYITARQSMRILNNALRMSGSPDFGLRLGRQLQPATHGAMGYLVLSSPDVITALESFADFLPMRLPFSSVHIALDDCWLRCSLTLKIEVAPSVRRLLQECFALMIQSIVESVLGREMHESRIELAHEKPDYYRRYADYLHSPVYFSRQSSTYYLPAAVAEYANASGNWDAYALAQNLCSDLLTQIPAASVSAADRVRRLLLSSPIRSVTATDIAGTMFVTKRTLQRRLEREGTSYREITEKLNSELALRHLCEPDQTVESISVLLGYFDTAAFRKAFRRWYGQSPGEYRRNL